jgi:hypothetical protein
MRTQKRMPIRSYRLPDYIDREIRKLSKQLGISQARVICMAIDRLAAHLGAKEKGAD